MLFVLVVAAQPRMVEGNDARAMACLLLMATGLVSTLQFVLGAAGEAGAWLLDRVPVASLQLADRLGDRGDEGLALHLSWGAALGGTCLILGAYACLLVYRARAASERERGMPEWPRRDDPARARLPVAARGVFKTVAWPKAVGRIHRAKPSAAQPGTRVCTV